MATREIKTRFVLDGETKFTKAMRESADSIKLLNSEQKLAEAQFEATGDAEQYAAEQARILRDQIENQKRAVKAAEDAVKSLTENGYSKNSKKVQTWQKKLNFANADLLEMQTKLSQLQSGVNSTGDRIDDQLSGIESGVKFQNTIAAIDNITEHIEKIIKAAARAAKAIWEMGVDAGQWADNLATAANEAGLDVETYQSWQYASRFIDTSVDDIVKSWKDIDSKLAQSGDSLYEYMGSMAKAGIAVRTTAGQMRQGKDIFWDTIDYLHNIADEQTRTSEAMRIFGNDWRKLNPLISAGSMAYKALALEGRSVAVVSEENVNALGAVDDAVQDMGARFDKLKYDTLAEMAPVFQKVAESLSLAITALDEFVQSEEGQAALQGLSEALSGIIDSFLGEDNGQKTFQSIVEGAAGAVNSFTDAMSWIKKNGWVVTMAVGALAAAWSGLKVTKEVLEFAQLLGGSKKSGGLFSNLFGKKASAEGLNGVTQSFSDAADTFASSADAAQKASEAASSAATAAKSSAEAAGSSAEGAGSSATASKSSETAAGSSATAAESSATAAGSSAEAAGSSATAAEGSETAAGSSATAAESSATAASSSAEAAGQAATAAGNSSAAAAGSADAAMSSVTASENSAIAAGNAALTAGNASTAAAGSADAALSAVSASENAALTAGYSAEAASQAALAAGSSADAAGQAAIAAGDSATAALESGTASGQAALSAGSSAEAAGQSALAAGSSAEASGQAALAAGNASAAASGSADAALSSAAASESSALAAGNAALAAGNASAAAAGSADAALSAVSASEQAALTAGYSTEAAQQSALAAGGSADAAGNSAIAAGDSATAAMSSAEAAASSAEAALSSAEAATTSVEAAATSAAAAAESALGAAAARASLEAAVAGALESAAGAAEARLKAEASAAAALKSAGVSYIKNGIATGKALLPAAGSGAAQAALPAGSSAASAGAAGSGWNPSVGGGYVSAADAINGILGLVAIVVGFEKAAEARRGDQEKLVDTAEHLAAATEGDDQLLKAFEEYVNTHNAELQASEDFAWGKITEEEFIDIIDKANAASEAFLKMEGADKVLDAYNTWRTGNAISDWILPENWEDLALNITGGFRDGIDAGLEDVEQAGQDIGDTTINAAEKRLGIKSPSRVFHVIGENVAVGMANGIYARGDEAIRAAKWLADSVTNIVQSALDIHSPSKKFEELGAFTGMGFAAGIEGSAAAVSRAVDHMIGATARQPAAAYAGVSLPAGGSIPGRITGAQVAGSGMVHVTMVLDEEVLGDVMAPIVNERIGAKIQAVRR